MRLVAIGRAADVRGFALAGVEVVACETEGEADETLRSLGADPTVGLVVVPAWIGQVAAAIERVRSRQGPAVILVLPGDPELVAELR